MKLCSHECNGKISYGVIGGDGGIIDLGKRIGARHPSLLTVLQREGGWALVRQASEGQPSDYRQSEVRFLPVFDELVTVHCIGLNYALHTAEAGVTQPDFPRSFIKVRASLVGHDDTLEAPTLSPQFDYEGELAAVIGKVARNVTQADALQYVCGYTCFNDGSVRDYQMERGVDQGKNFFRSSSMGPCLVTTDEVGDVADLFLTTLLNGEQMQYSGCDKLMFPVPALVAYLSAITELRPGDVIATGTPQGVGFKRQPPRFMRSGDTLEVHVTRIGTLRNRVA